MRWIDELVAGAAIWQEVLPPGASAEPETDETEERTNLGAPQQLGRAVVLLLLLRLYLTSNSPWSGRPPGDYVNTFSALCSHTRAAAADHRCLLTSCLASPACFPLLAGAVGGWVVFRVVQQTRRKVWEDKQCFHEAGRVFILWQVSEQQNMNLACEEQSCDHLGRLCLLRKRLNSIWGSKWHVAHLKFNLMYVDLWMDVGVGLHSTHTHINIYTTLLPLTAAKWPKSLTAGPWNNHG